MLSISSFTRHASAACLALYTASAGLADDRSPLTLDLGNGASVTLYGYIKADFVWDNGFQLGSTTSPLVDIGLPGGPAVGDFEEQLLNETRFGFRVRGNDMFSGVFEWDFFGPNDNARLRLAYLDLGPVRVGQDWINFLSTEVLADTVDFQGAGSQPFAREPQIRVAFDVTQDWNLLAAIEEDKGNSDDMAYVLAARYGFDDGMVRASTLFRDTTLGGVAVDGWGINLASTITPWTNGRFKLNAVWGDGIADYLGAGLSGTAVSKGGSEVGVTGVSVGYTHQVTPKLKLAATYDWTDVDQATGTETATLEALHLSAFYDVLENTRLMAEYYVGERTQGNGVSFDVDRVQLAIRYSF